jgi:hypothetical protein
MTRRLGQEERKSRPDPGPVTPAPAPDIGTPGGPIGLQELVEESLLFSGRAGTTFLPVVTQKPEASNFGIGFQLKPGEECSLRHACLRHVLTPRSPACPVQRIVNSLSRTGNTSISSEVLILETYFQMQIGIF